MFSDLAKDSHRVSTFGTQRWLKVTAIAVGIISICGGLGGCVAPQRTVSLSSGRDQSAYARIGGKIQQLAEQVNLTVEDNLDSQGSQQNLDRLMNGEVDFAIAQLDVASEAMKAGQVVAVAILTEEYVHLITHEKAGINSFPELKDKTVNIGPPGSGINFTASRIFNALNLVIKENITPQTDEGLKNLTQQKLDALVYVGPLKASDQVREQLIKLPGLQFLPLDESFINYLTLQFPESYRASVIPKGTYKPFPALPSTDIKTITTSGALLTRPDVNKDTVALMTWAIISNARQFSPFYPKLANEQGEVNLSEGLLYLHPGAQQAYSNGDPRVAWLKYLQQNTPLQAASIMLISTTTLGFLISWWRKRHSNKLQQAHRQAIAELQNQLKIDPHQALLDTESLMQGYRLMMIEGNLSPDLYREIDHINDVFIQQCRSARQQQQSQELNEVIDYINSLITSTDSSSQDRIQDLSNRQATYREMVLKGQLEISTYLSLYQIQLLSRIFSQTIPSQVDQLD